MTTQPLPCPLSKLFKASRNCQRRAIQHRCQSLKLTLEWQRFTTDKDFIALFRRPICWYKLSQSNTMSIVATFDKCYWIWDMTLIVLLMNHRLWYGAKSAECNKLSLIEKNIRGILGMFLYQGRPPVRTKCHGIPMVHVLLIAIKTDQHELFLE